MQSSAIVTIKGVRGRSEAVAVLNDLTAQFLDISTKVFEIEEQLANLKKILFDLISDGNTPQRKVHAYGLFNGG